MDITELASHELKKLSELIVQEGVRKEFEYKGYHCLILRNDFDILCGYVCIDNTQLPLKYDTDIYKKIRVHGGLTFSGRIDGRKYLGFDCAHHSDYIPKLPIHRGTYRTIKFVENEIKVLVGQLIEILKKEE